VKKINKIYKQTHYFLLLIYTENKCHFNDV